MNRLIAFKIKCSWRLSEGELNKTQFFIGSGDRDALIIMTGVRPCRKTTGDIVGWKARLNIPVAIKYKLITSRVATILNERQREELQEWFNNRAEVHLFREKTQIIATGKTAPMIISRALSGKISKKDINRLGTNVTVYRDRVSGKITLPWRGNLPFTAPKRLIDLMKYAYDHRTLLIIYSHIKAEPAEISLKEPLTLRDYQQEAVDFFVKNGRALINMPPGAGKTFVGLGAIAQMKCKTVVLVPMRVLKKQWQQLIDMYFNYNREPREDDNDIVVMTYQHALRHNQRYFANRMVIADEAHHLGGKVFRLFARHGTPVLALTATPYRGDSESQRILSTFPWFESTATWREWEKLYTSIVVPRVMVGPRNTSTLRKIIARHKSVLILCREIRTAEQLAKKLGIAYIHANASNKDTILSRFRDGKINALATTVLLSQGFDYPGLEAVVVWDTGGIITTLQFIGRVMRKENGNKKYAYLFTGKGGLNAKRLGRILDILGVESVKMR